MISSKGIYGLQFLIQLASNYESGEFTQLSSVSRKEFISDKYLEAIAALLKKGGFLKVKRGAGGGYMLSSRPDTINLFQILSVLDGIDQEGVDEPEGLTSNRIAVNTLVTDMMKNIEIFLRSKSLKDLLEISRNNQEFANYQI